jgi:hypothetical protein
MGNNEITIHHRNGVKVIEVDMKKAKHHGIPWIHCSEFQKRKYENFLFLANQERNRIKFIYQ